MKKIKYVVYSIRDYRSGPEDKVTTNVRVDMQLWDGPCYADMDSSVYEMDDFMDIHEIYKKAISETFEYDYSVYFKYIAKIKQELMSLA